MEGHRNDRSLAACSAGEPGAKVALAVGLLVVVAIAAAVSIKAMVSARASQQHTVSYSSQVVLPFAHLNKPWGAAVDGAGNLYIADHRHPSAA